MKRERKPITDGGELGPAAQVLFERLKVWRRETAAADNVPAYVILHDRVLREIALQRPQSIEALGTISGIGENKLRRFGPPLLALVNDG
jgi:ATP-dependent DNA helicase RecQ